MRAGIRSETVQHAEVVHRALHLLLPPPAHVRLCGPAVPPPWPARLSVGADGSAGPVAIIPLHFSFTFVLPLNRFFQSQLKAPHHRLDLPGGPGRERGRQLALHRCAWLRGLGAGRVWIARVRHSQQPPVGADGLVLGGLLGALGVRQVVGRFWGHALVITF